MPVAVATGWLSPSPRPADLLALARELDVRTVFFSTPVALAARWRAELRGGGVHVGGVAPVDDRGASDEDAAGFAALLAAAVDCASGLKASALVVGGGGLGAAVIDALREADAALLEAARAEAATPEPAVGGDDWRTLRDGAREAAAERAVRALHAAHVGGVPLAVRHGAGPVDLLGFEETGWVLDELPGLRVWLDPARADRAHRLGWGPPAAAWADAYAGRCGGVFVHGLGEAWRGGAHPADVGVDWRGLAEILPRRVPWVLDVAPDLPRDGLADALAMLRADLGRDAS